MGFEPSTKAHEEKAAGHQPIADLAKEKDLRGKDVKQPACVQRGSGKKAWGKKNGKDYSTGEWGSKFEGAQWAKATSLLSR